EAIAVRTFAPFDRLWQRLGGRLAGHVRKPPRCPQSLVAQAALASTARSTNAMFVAFDLMVRYVWLTGVPLRWMTHTSAITNTTSAKTINTASTIWLRLIVRRRASNTDSGAVGSSVTIGSARVTATDSLAGTSPTFAVATVSLGTGGAATAVTVV